ncbi:MAG: class I SAM-dependent methyltransferase [Candidatus Eremiobacteraeota bacterium]|nr:class I SAM-dependent methyltransferase [Candidatus Eremiobacteraeota bacterium]
MNAGLDVDHASIHYYDGDYPSEEHSLFPENFDATTVSQGIRHDVRRYKELASQIGGPILELCCGTGRVAIPLAKAEFDVTGVDVSRPILEQFRGNLRRESQSVCQRITIVEQDITTLELDYDAYPLAIIAFNSLLLVTDFDSQLRALRRAAAHLCDGGLLVLDIVNPLCLKIDGDPLPKPFFTRKNPNSGNLYTRFAMSDPLDENQCQRLHGWYDEIEAGGGMTRRFYSLHWRPIYRFEVELMLQSAGCRIETVEGGHLGERFAARSPRMFIQARKGG